MHIKRFKALEKYIFVKSWYFLVLEALLKIRLNAKPLILVIVLTLGGEGLLAQSRKMESYWDLDLTVRGWFERNSELESVTSNPTLSGSITHTWRRKGRSSHLRQHVKINRSVSSKDIDGYSTFGIEYGQSLEGKVYDTEWSFGYVEVPGRRFSAFVLESSISRQIPLAKKNLNLNLAIQGTAFDNMNGSSRDKGSNLILQFESDLKFNPRIRPKVGPFDRFEASVGADWTHLIIGNRPKVTSNLTTAIGLTGKLENGTKIGLFLTGQNGVPAPKFATRSRLGCRLDLSWRIKS